MHLHVMFSLQKADMIIVNCCYLNLVKKKKNNQTNDYGVPFSSILTFYQ